MARNIARVKIKMVISLVKLSFLVNSEITVFHRYLYNKFVYCMGVTIISNVRAIPLLMERHVTRFQPINVSK